MTPDPSTSQLDVTLASRGTQTRDSHSDRDCWVAHRRVNHEQAITLVRVEVQRIPAWRNQLRAEYVVRARIELAVAGRLAPPPTWTVPEITKGVMRSATSATSAESS
jgi:hypothetical protein